MNDIDAWQVWCGVRITNTTLNYMFEDLTIVLLLIWRNCKKSGEQSRKGLSKN